MRLYLILIINLLFLSKNAVFGQNIEFKPLDFQVELASTRITALLEDEEGFMWIGTRRGLLKYDGFQLNKIIIKDTFDNALLDVTSLAETKSKIWLGTLTGVFSIDKISGEINEIKEQNIRCRVLKVNNEGNVCIGSNNGLKIYNPKNKSIQVYQSVSNLAGTLSNNIVREIYEDKDSVLWIGTYDGLNKLNTTTGNITSFYLMDSKENKRNNLILDIEPFDEKTLLIGTETGLALFDKHNGTFEKLQTSNSGLSNDVIKKVCKIDNQQIWIGTDYGLTIWEKDLNRFQNYFSNYMNSYSISNNVVEVIYKDKKGNIWVGTNKGLDIYGASSLFFDKNKVTKYADYLRNGIEVFDLDKRNGVTWIATNEGVYAIKDNVGEVLHIPSNQFLHKKLKDIHIDKSGDVWISSPGGLNLYSKGKMYSYVAEKGKKDALQTNYLYRIVESSKGQIWIGTLHGLYSVQKSEGHQLKFYAYKNDPTNSNSIAKNRIVDIFFDEDDNPILLLSDQINIFNLKKGIFEKIKFDNDINLCSSGSMDQDGNIWITFFKGIYKFNPKEKQIKLVVQTESVLRGRAVKLENKVWFTTSSKLKCYDLSEKKTYSFEHRNTGVNFFNENNHQIGDEIFFPAQNGILLFKPQNIEINLKPVEVKVTALKVRGENKWVEGNDNLKIKYDDNSFTIEFTNFDYIPNKTRKYRYKLAGLETEWNLLSGENYQVNYNKVKPGNFVFKIQSSDDIGDNWGKETQQAIIISPPLWATWWAKLGYVSLLALLVYIGVKYSLEKLKKENVDELRRMELAKNEEMTELKIKFFTNLSHELRTPLTLIKSPLEELIQKENDPTKNRLLVTVDRSASRLIKLVNQILDLRKIDKKEESLLLEEVDLVKCIKNIVEEFSEMIIQREMRLNFVTDYSKLNVLVDLEKIEKIIFNLISNAIKFTHDKGIIEIELSKENDQLCLQVKDNGIGISKEIQSKIFDRFVNLRIPNYTGQQGSGIGLSLVNEYVKMHEGSIELMSDEDKGSTFKIMLPYRNNENVEVQLSTSQMSVGETEKEDEIAIDKDKPVVLVIDDDDEMRSFLTISLGETYNVVTSKDGKEGEEKALSLLPDLIISDLMMPKQNGFELLKQLKKNQKTKMIPFLLLTAKDGVESQLESYQEGVSSYMAKPFKTAILKAKIHNLLKQREGILQMVKREITITPTMVEHSEEENEFIQVVINAIEKNMENPEFTVKELGAELGVSHTNLYRKVKAETDMTSNELIRSVRMKRAAQLLSTQKYNVSDVMYMVGFSHNSYFTKSFKAVIGQTPKGYLKECKKQKVEQS